MTARHGMHPDYRRYLAGKLMQAAGSGRTQGQAGRALGLTARVTGQICREYEIEFLAVGLRSPVEPRRAKPWPELEAAVEELRRHHAPVCAEATIRRPHMVPRPYGPRTRFRVGDRWGVTATEILELAEACRRRPAA
jgi:hypothetical protein